MKNAELPKCVLCGFNDGHNEWCDRNPAKGQPIEYQLARVACAITVPKGFAQCVDGTDGMRVGTNVASVEEWRQFFVTFLAQGVLQTEQPEEDMDADWKDNLRAIAVSPQSFTDSGRRRWVEVAIRHFERKEQANGEVDKDRLLAAAKALYQELWGGRGTTWETDTHLHNPSKHISLTVLHAAGIPIEDGADE